MTRRSKKILLAAIEPCAFLFMLTAASPGRHHPDLAASFEGCPPAEELENFFRKLHTSKWNVNALDEKWKMAGADWTFSPEDKFATCHGRVTATILQRVISGKGECSITMDLSLDGTPDACSGSVSSVTIHRRTKNAAEAEALRERLITSVSPRTGAHVSSLHGSGNLWTDLWQVEGKYFHIEATIDRDGHWLFFDVAWTATD